MESRPISEYVVLGGVLRYLLHAREGWPIHEEEYVLPNINLLLGRLEKFELTVSQRVAWRLVQLRDELAESASDAKLTAEQASRLTEIMDVLEKTLLAETGGKVAFIVVDKRYDVNKLLSDVPALLAPGVFHSLPDIAQYDLMEAGKCIAFEHPTAAAFHMLRGTEAVLRQFYCSVVKRGRVKQLLWGPMVESLRSRSKPPPAALLNNLDNIRVSFRNPTQHPDKRYDIHEAQDLFGLCLDVLNRMVSFLSW